MWERGLKQHLVICARRAKTVAPHVGAWIETYQCQAESMATMSLPMWERGLKHSPYNG